MQPLVSVIIAAYQQPAFLNAALQSVAAQTYPHLEILIIDDASGEKFTAQYKLPPSARLFINDRNHATAAINRNIALRQAAGKYIAFLDQDDLWQPNKIAAQVAALEAHPAALLHFTNLLYVSEDLQPLKQKPEIAALKNPFRELLHKNIIIAPSQVMMPRAALDRIGPFDESIRGAADWDMWIRAAAAGPLLNEPRPLTLYRRHSAQWSNSSLMLVKGAEKVMAKCRAYSQTHPHLANFIRHKHARTIRNIARVQWQLQQETDQIWPNLRRAFRLWPLDRKNYTLLLRLLLIPRPSPTPKKEST